MQNFKTVAQALLGETAHFGFCPPKIGLIEGVGGVPEIFFSLESSYLCYLGAHAKIQNPTTIPSGVKGRRVPPTTTTTTRCGKISKIVAYGCFDTVCTAPLGPK